MTEEGKEQHHASQSDYKQQQKADMIGVQGEDYKCWLSGALEAAPKSTHACLNLHPEPTTAGCKVAW